MWRKSFSFLLFSVFIVIFSGCKDEEEVGLNLLPPGDILYTHFTDSATVSSYTRAEDSLQADELSVQLLGSYTDPAFGIATASIFAHVNLVGTPTFGVTPVADSLVLSLAYSGYYGDTTGTQTVQVFRMTEDMYIDSTYYSSRSFAYDASPLGSVSFTPQPGTRIVVGSDTVAPQLRIPLSQALADSIVALNGTSTFSSNANWLSYLKGLFIQASDAGAGAISYFNFQNSKLTLYFRDSSNTAKTYDFSLAGGRVNRFSHNFNGSPAGMQILDSTMNESVNYIQGMGGTKTRVSFPYLKHFLDSGSILINRAELKIEIETPVDNLYPVPGNLLLITKNDEGAHVFPVDYFESTAYYGGRLNSSSNSYSFNIARHLQRYLNGTVSNADFFLVVSGSGVDASRVIVRSGQGPVSKMRLYLYYTKLN